MLYDQIQLLTEFKVRLRNATKEHETRHGRKKRGVKKGHEC